MGSVSCSRWAAIGAAVAVSLGAGGMLTASAAIDAGERAVFVAITPCRVLDTRPAPDMVGPRSSPVGPGETYSIPVTGSVGRCTIPQDASALVLNVAVVSPTANSYLTVFPTGGAVPLAANLNFVAGQAPVSNAATVDVGADGQISFYNLAGQVHVTADVSGYYISHTHDDRYQRRAQTIIVDGSASTFFGPGWIQATENGCFANSGSAAPSRLSTPLPVGAVVVGGRVGMLDGLGPTAYTGQLRASRLGELGVDIAPLAPSFGGGSRSVETVIHEIVLAEAFVVQPNETVVLDVQLGAGSNGLCQLQLDVIMP